MKSVTFREMTLDERVCWGFCLATAVVGIAAIAAIDLGMGLPLWVVGVGGMYLVRRRFSPQTAARADRPDTPWRPTA